MREIGAPLWVVRLEQVNLALVRTRKGHHSRKKRALIERYVKPLMEHADG